MSLSEQSLSRNHTPKMPVRSLSKTPSTRGASLRTVMVTHHPTLLGCASPVRLRLADSVSQPEKKRLVPSERHVPSERLALHQALQESQAHLRAEARRAGAAEALLQERTATLAAVVRHEHGNKRTSSMAKRCSSSSSSYGSASTASANDEMQIEAQCKSAHENLREKLSEKESEACRSSDTRKLPSFCVRDEHRSAQRDSHAVVARAC